MEVQHILQIIDYKTNTIYDTIDFGSNDPIVGVEGDIFTYKNRDGTHVFEVHEEDSVLDRTAPDTIVITYKLYVVSYE